MVSNVLFFKYGKMFTDPSIKFGKPCNLFGPCDKALMYYVSSLKSHSKFKQITKKMEFLGFHITA